MLRVCSQSIRYCVQETCNFDAIFAYRKHFPSEPLPCSILTQSQAHVCVHPVVSAVTCGNYDFRYDVSARTCPALHTCSCTPLHWKSMMAHGRRRSTTNKHLCIIRHRASQRNRKWLAVKSRSCGRISFECKRDKRLERHGFQRLEKEPGKSWSPSWSVPPSRRWCKRQRRGVEQRHGRRPSVTPC